MTFTPRAWVGWLGLLGMGLAGCSTTYIPVVTPGTRCELPEAARQACARPLLLSQGLTYAELLKAYQEDRRSLQDCATRQAAAVKAVQTCNQEIDRLNADLTKLNQAVQSQ